MNKVFQVMQTDQGVKRAITAYGLTEGQSQIYGVTGVQKSALLAAAYQSNPRPMVIITGNHESVEYLRLDLATLIPEAVVLELPVLDMITFAA